MIKHISIISCSLLIAANANAATIKGNWVGCISKASLDEFQVAHNKKDSRHMESLLGSQCYSINGREYSIVKRGFLTSQIRVYAGGGSALLWVPTEATR